MVMSCVLHFYGNLKDHIPFCNLFEKSWKVRLREIKCLIDRVDTDARHPVYLMATPYILLPVRPVQIYGSERHQCSISTVFTLFKKPDIDSVYIFEEK